MQFHDSIRGISVCNPVDLDLSYMLDTAEYAISNRLNHYQFIGPIHNPIKGNIDGMTFYRKYAEFNQAKDLEYINSCVHSVNIVCDKLYAAGIKTYMWHHELEVPEGFIEAYPEICNEFGDVEITHPIIRDFLEHKIFDFFATYPKMDGIILTLHETRIPLLKLKHQKLGKIERVQYVTKILFDCCTSLGKELIVRPFASIPEDYEMMAQAYSQISTDLVIMDKWTQFDWSLTLPPNSFFSKIKNNPLLVETDIFGEYFGQGQLPIMLKDHISKNYAHSLKHAPIGFVSRYDRAGHHSFGDVNEVNYHIMQAFMDGQSIDAAIEDFFYSKYASLGPHIQRMMARTEALQKHILYLNGYYFTQGSTFPAWNHCKNHFFLELMKEEYALVSGEWFIPGNWQRGTVDSLLLEKENAVNECIDLLQQLAQIKEDLPDEQYLPLRHKFLNLYYISKIWATLTHVLFHYVKFFEYRSADHEYAFFEALHELAQIEKEATNTLGDSFYINYLCGDQLNVDKRKTRPIQTFIYDATSNFRMEKELLRNLETKNYTDFIICGSGMEGHKLKKEVNFSDTYITDGICRIPGTYRGKSFSAVNTHGWFSYEIKILPNSLNTISVVASGSEDIIDFTIRIGNLTYTVHDTHSEKKEYHFQYRESSGLESIRIRIDRMSEHTPFIYLIYAH